MKKLKVSNKIYEYFQKKYGFGDLGVILAVSANSVWVKNNKLGLSLTIISPKGHFKSSIMEEVASMFNVLYIRGLVTEYGIEREYRASIEGKCVPVFIDDIEDTIRGMQRRRVVGILGFLKGLIDGKGQITVRDRTIILKPKKFAIVLNVPDYLLYKSTGVLQNMFTSTFFDRTLPVKYSMDWEKWKEMYDKGKLKDIDPPKVKRYKKEKVVKFPRKFRKEISDIALKLMNLKFSGLPRNIELLKAFLAGNALLNKRNKVYKEDIELFLKFIKYIRWY